jgi:hypothetical protein
MYTKHSLPTESHLYPAFVRFSGYLDMASKELEKRKQWVKGVWSR